MIMFMRVVAGRNGPFLFFLSSVLLLSVMVLQFVVMLLWPFSTDATVLIREKTPEWVGVLWGALTLLGIGAFVLAVVTQLRG
jgi:hypothetical protein